MCPTGVWLELEVERPFVALLFRVEVPFRQFVCGILNPGGAVDEAAGDGVAEGVG